MKISKILWYVLLLLVGDVVIASFNLSSATTIFIGALWGAFIGYKIAKGMKNE